MARNQANVSVLIPYRPTTVERERRFEYVVSRLGSGFPDWEIVARGDNPATPEQPFSRASAINNAAQEAYGDIFLTCDADTFTNESILWQAYNQVIQTGSWVLPYTVYYNLTEGYTEYLLGRVSDMQIKEPLPTQVDHALDYVVSGMVMLPRELFERVGGMDEKFVGWGYEDDAFSTILTAYAGGVHRTLGGFVCHLWHEVPEDAGFNNPNIEQNRALYMKYRQLRNDPTELLRLRQS